jgi:CRISPR system Cascade subunit CasB
MHRFPTEHFARADAASGPPATDADSLPNHPADRMNRAIGKIAKRMEPDGTMSTGDQAELRRISPENPYTPALWKRLFEYDLEDDWLGLGQEVYERRMATLLMGMAHCAGHHNYNVSLGTALAEAGWSELRFVRLMEARGETLETLLRRLAQYLASKGQDANWADVAWLLLRQEGDNAERTRLGIARQYYGTLHRQDTSD